MKRHYVVWGFVALFVLLATPQAQAKTQISLSDQGKVNKGIVFVTRGQLLRAANQLGLTIRTIRISKRDLAKLASSGPKGCGCAPSEDFAGSGWQCFKDCLAEAQVSYATAVACAAA